MEKPFSISLIRCPSGFFPLPFRGLSKPSPFLRQFHLLVRPNLATSSWPQFQKQKHFIRIRFSHRLKGRMGLHFSLDGKGAYLFWTHPLALGPSSSDHPHGPDSAIAFFTNDEHSGAFSNIKNESDFGLETCRPCLGQRAFLEACSWRRTAPTTPSPSHHGSVGT